MFKFDRVDLISPAKMHVIVCHVHRRAGNFHIPSIAACIKCRGLRYRFVMGRLKEKHRVILFRGADTHTRSVLKAISWRTLGTLDTFAISWFMTGKLHVAGSIAGMEVITKIAWYYLHERLWTVIPWGHHDRGGAAA
jgi:uncharacterized membrane protein